MAFLSYVMRIKSVEIVGFKSFYEACSVMFHPGINALVGPNGCGKSNVLDSIKWVLGEQNPRRLRAEVMEQVISTGGDNLKPLGMAEVALNLVGIGEGGFEEIQVKRRLFRSGESEYFINGVPARLKDITEMFMDTGTGSRAYSVVDQGRIEQIIMYKPEDRRAFVEEVSGVQKYKLRRKETQSRINSTEENLGRVGDIVGEVERRMKALSQQAKRAEEFRRISKEAKLLERGLRKFRLRELERKLEGMESGIGALREKVIMKEALISRIEEALDGAEGMLKTNEKRIEEALEGVSKIRENLQARRSLVEISQSEILGADDYINKEEREIELLRQEVAALESRLLAKDSQRESVCGEITVMAVEIERREGELAGLRDAHTEHVNEIDAIRKNVYEALDKESGLKALTHGLERQLAELKRREGHVEEELAESREQIERTQAELRRLQDTFLRLSRERAEIAERRDELSAALSGLVTAHDALEGRKSGLIDRIGECRSRLGALKQIERSYEWLPEGVRTFLLERKGAGVLGIVADFVSVPKGYERALEAALGERLKWVVVEDEGVALETLGYIYERSEGRVTVLPVSGQSAYEHRPADPMPQGAEYLPDIITVSGSSGSSIMGSLICGLLGGVFVVPTLEEALKMRRDGVAGARYVSLKGEFLDSMGAMTGGASTTQGVFEMKREIEDLGEKIAAMEDERAAVTEELQVSKGEVERLEGAIKSLDDSLLEIEFKEVETRKDLTNLEERLGTLRQRADLLGLDLEQTTAEIEEKGERLGVAKVEASALEGQRRALEQRHAELREKAELQEGNQKTVEAAIVDLRVQKAALDEKRAGIEEDINGLRERLQSANEKIEREGEEVLRKRVLQQELNETIETANTEIAKLKGAVEEALARLEALKTGKESVMSKVDLHREEKEAHRRELSELNRQLNSRLIEENKVEIEIDHIRGAESELSGSLEDENAAAAAAADDEWLEEMGIEAAYDKLSTLKAKLDRFGAVNLLAPEEYKELEERHEFLTAQVEDLTEALNTLRQAMQKIDSESQRRFLEGFTQLNEKFVSVFPKLFPGGEAKLVLTDPDDLLETGVDVVIRPPGKKFQQITLLSGGEKALSAIVLIISACLIRPVPFLLLDEIDGPLDDSNTTQFVDLLKEVSDVSQVVVVSHNKKTMQAASSLVGITSDKPGTSRVVSVELGEVDDYERREVGTA